jgi:WD40 repeat protein
VLLLAFVLSTSATAAPPRTDRTGDALPPDAVARAGTVRWRHGGPVLALAFAPDGKTLASVSGDGSLRLWDSSTGRELRRFLGHKGEVRCVAFAPDGNSLLSGGADGTARLWDVKTGKERAKLLTAEEWLNAVAFAPKGKWLAAGSDEGTVHLWDATTLRKSRDFRAAGSVQGLAFLRDGTLAVGAANDEGVILWTTQGEKLRQFKAFPQSFAVSPEGHLVAISDYNNPSTLHDLRTGHEVRKLAGAGEDGDVLRVASLAWSPDGRTLAGASSGGRIRLWNTADGQLRQILRGHAGEVKAVAFSPEGRVLASAGEDSTIRVWDAATGKERAPAAGHRGAITAALSPDGKSLATVGQDGGLRLWEASTGKERERVEGEGTLDCVAFAPDGKVLATGGSRGEVQLRDPVTGKLRRVLPGHRGTVSCLAFTRDGRSLVSGGHDRTLRQWDLRTGKLTHTAGGWANSRIESLAVSPDGARVLAADRAVPLRLVELATGTEIERFAGHPGGSVAVAFSPTGRQAASGGRERMVRLWEVSSGKQRREVGGHAGWVTAVGWSPDGEVLVSGHSDGTVRLWDPLTGKELQEMAGHQGAVRSLSFSANGGRLVSAGDDTTALVWDVQAAVRAGRTQILKFSVDELNALWKELASNDASVAAVAVQKLARAHPQALPLLSKQLKPVTKEELAQLLLDLDSPRYTTRDRAMQRLAALGKFIEPALRKVIREQPSLEVRARVEVLLSKREATGGSPEELQVLRALEVLEMIGTAEAGKVLERLAGGAPECDLTREAKAALERLAQRPPGK